MFKCCRLRYERMRDDKNGLELFHEMFSYKFIKKLNLLDILPHTTGRNHSSPNENIPGGRSQPVRFSDTLQKKPKKWLRWQCGLARQAVLTLSHLQAKIPVSYPTLISEIENYFQK